MRKKLLSTFLSVRILRLLRFGSLKRMKCRVQKIAHKNRYSSILEVPNCNIMSAKDRTIKRPYLPYCQLVKETTSNPEL